MLAGRRTVGERSVPGPNGGLPLRWRAGRDAGQGPVAKPRHLGSANRYTGALSCALKKKGSLACVGPRPLPTGAGGVRGLEAQGAGATWATGWADLISRRGLVLLPESAPDHTLAGPGAAQSRGLEGPRDGYAPSCPRLGPAVSVSARHVDGTSCRSGPRPPRPLRRHMASPGVELDDRWSRAPRQTRMRQCSASSAPTSYGGDFGVDAVCFTSDRFERDLAQPRIGPTECLEIGGAVDPKSLPSRPTSAPDRP